MAPKPTVAVTRVIPEAGLRLVREATEMRLWPDELPPSPEQLAELLHGCDGALTLLTDRIDGPVLDRDPQLKVVSNFAVGYDNIDVPAATARGVAVCNTPGVLTNATADATWSLLMAAARRIPEGIQYVRDGKWKTWGPTLLLGQEVTGATLGVIGFGRIGREVAKRAKGFDMNVLVYDTYRDEAAEQALGVTFRPLDDLLRESDFVTLHVALTAETRHLVSHREFGLMKPAAVLVNALVRLAALAVITVDPAFMPLQATAVLPATVVGAGAAVIVYALLARFTARPLSTFRTVAAIALPLSYLPDLALLAFMPGATLAAVLVLMLMHTLTAVIVVGLLTRFTRAR